MAKIQTSVKVTLSPADITEMLVSNYEKKGIIIKRSDVKINIAPHPSEKNTFLWDVEATGTMREKKKKEIKAKPGKESAPETNAAQQ